MKALRSQETGKKPQKVGVRHVTKDGRTVAIKAHGPRTAHAVKGITNKEQIKSGIVRKESRILRGGTCKSPIITARVTPTEDKDIINPKKLALAKEQFQGCTLPEGW